jgi:hypothetical protein
MNNKEFKSSERASGLANAERGFTLPVVAGQYTAPDIEVFDIELSQNVLQTSGNAPSNFEGEEW